VSIQRNKIKTGRQGEGDRKAEDRKGVRMQQAHGQEALETELPCGPGSPDSTPQRKQVF